MLFVMNFLRRWVDRSQRFMTHGILSALVFIKFYKVIWWFILLTSRRKGWVYINYLVTNMFLCGIFEHLLQEKSLKVSLLFLETNAEGGICRVVWTQMQCLMSCCSFPYHRSQMPNVYNISFFFFVILHEDKPYANNQDVSFKWWCPVASLHSMCWLILRLDPEQIIICLSSLDLPSFFPSHAIHTSNGIAWD